MVVKDDGTKWACLSCLKGHRVSGCNHIDRELVLVPKKGRPVTQCHHCRQERKKRSAHVRCDCGEIDKPHHPREKCIHLREAEERCKAGLNEESCQEKDPAHIVAIAEEQGCCCHHGGKCSCSLLLKKDWKDEDGLPHGPAVKPRLESTRSEGSITVFQNGHHKPVHRKNNAAHECGMPYKMPMTRCATDQAPSRTSRRSVDSLTDEQRALFESRPSIQQHAPVSDHGFEELTTAPPTFQESTQYAASSTGHREFAFVRSQSASHRMPDMAAYDGSDGLVDNTYESWLTLPSNMLVSPHETLFDSWQTHADAAAMIQPALTVASSGTQSEIDEIPNVADMYTNGIASGHEHSSIAPILYNTDSPQPNRHSLPPNFLRPFDPAEPSSETWYRAATLGFGDDEMNKSQLDYSSTQFNDPWQATVAQSTVGDFLPLENYASASQAVGPSSMSGDDLMRQLFPDLDTANATYSTHQVPESASSAEVPFQAPSRPGADSLMQLPLDKWSGDVLNIDNFLPLTASPHDQVASDAADTQRWPQ